MASENGFGWFRDQGSWPRPSSQGSPHQSTQANHRTFCTGALRTLAGPGPLSGCLFAAQSSGGAPGRFTMLWGGAVKRVAHLAALPWSSSKIGCETPSPSPCEAPPSCSVARVSGVVDQRGASPLAAPEVQCTVARGHALSVRPRKLLKATEDTEDEGRLELSTMAQAIRLLGFFLRMGSACELNHFFEFFRFRKKRNSTSSLDLSFEERKADSSGHIAPEHGTS